MTHVPYRGSGPAIVDLIAGHVPAAVLPLGSLLPHAKAGKIKVLGQSGENRSPSLPEAPSFKELGFPMLAVSGWYGLFAPAGTRPDIVDRYNEVVLQALRTPELKERMRGFELDIRELSAQEFLAMVKTDTERWGPIIRASGFTASSE
jgi:tripartite-type tricarboxylate transporter receptor subunit TctC